MCSVTLSFLTLCDPTDCSGQVPLFMGVSRQEYWSGLPFPSPGDLLNPGMEPTSFESSALAGGFLTTKSYIDVEGKQTFQEKQIGGIKAW